MSENSSPVTQCYIPGYLNAWGGGEPVWGFEKLNNILLHSAVSFSVLILWPATHNSHTCMCHFVTYLLWHKIHTPVCVILWPTSCDTIHTPVCAILWPTSCNTQFTQLYVPFCDLPPATHNSYTCMCHFTVSCSLYRTTDIYCMYTVMSLSDFVFDKIFYALNT